MPCPSPISRFRCPNAALAFFLTVVLAGCAGRPQAPRLVQPTGSAASNADTLTRLNALLPADAILLGEQHDAAEHQQLAQQVIAELAGRQLLAALTLEMADIGAGTGSLQSGSSEIETRRALRWNDKGWPWRVYGPAVMAAVRAGVPVLGANLPASAMRGSMADSALDSQLSAPSLKAQQQLIRSGHCDLLPESQIVPMTRIQIAKDIAMARTVTQASLPGKVVVLMAGSGHVNRELGVPQHLPATLDAKAVHLRAGEANDAADRDSAFDSTWSTPALAGKDYCADLRQQFGNRVQGAGETRSTP